MQPFIQMLAAIFVALGDASGTLPEAKRILSRALRDGAINDPTARAVIGACATTDAAKKSRWPDGSWPALLDLLLEIVNYRERLALRRKAHDRHKRKLARKQQRRAPQ